MTAQLYKSKQDIEEHQLIMFFPQECPSGVVNEETFKHIYAQFFPHGGKEHHFPPSFTAL